MAQTQTARLVWQDGQVVQALWHVDSAYYPATLLRRNRDQTWRVRWEDGTQDNVPESSLKRRRGRPALLSKSHHGDNHTASVINMPFGDKQQAFRRLAAARTERTINYIRLIQNLSDRRHYRYTAGEVATIFTALREAIDDAEKKFSDGIQRAPIRFF
jgi:hypothetical protein